jgi:DNA invertase Pin-like site-specific DNA recombinase
VLLVAYVARWQRNLRQTLNLLEEVLHPAGVAVYFCDEELLSSNERHWDQLVDEAKAADSWLRKHRRRVREGLAAKLATKRDPGGRPPLGFRRNADKLMEPDPNKASVVRRVIELSAAGATDQEIAAEVCLPLFTVRGVLTSPLYAGRLRDGGPANWPVVDASLARRAPRRRATRATDT